MSYHVVALWPVVMLDSVIVVECHDLFSLCLYNTDHCFPLSSNLSATNSTSSSVRVIIRSSLVCFLFITDMHLYWFTLNLHIKSVLKRGVDLCLYRLKRRRGETRNSNMFACFNHNSASYFSSNLELDLRLITTQHYTLVRK